jgi:LuxR family maltose regulon positive regulatory protein
VGLQAERARLGEADAPEVVLVSDRPLSPPGAVLLATKLQAPVVRREIVSRPRLIERLGASVWPKVTLISAPAGSGKTTLLA